MSIRKLSGRRETDSIQQDIFKSMIQQSIFAVASDKTRPILTGALVEIQNGSISMICLDGYRLALKGNIAGGI